MKQITITAELVRTVKVKISKQIPDTPQAIADFREGVKNNLDDYIHEGQIEQDMVRLKALRVEREIS